MRYFGRLSFNGTSFVGWQNQPNGTSVQSLVEKAISTLVRKEIEITGCGRTDTGVHASRFYFHFDLNLILNTGQFIFKLNSLLPESIIFDQLLAVDDHAHARYDALQRTYRYYIIGKKNPFKTDAVFWFRQFHQLDIEKVKKAAGIIACGEDFFSFSKANSDVRNYICRLDEIEWEQPAPNILVMKISANRFLRGMVRLIVGACLNAGLDKVNLSEIEIAISEQKRLEKPWSVPACGLYLADVKYPFIETPSIEETYFFEPFGPFAK